MTEKKIDKKQEKKPVYKKWWFWVIIAVVVIAIGSAGGNDNGAKKVGTNGEETSIEQTEFHVGDVISYNGQEITVKSVERNYTTGNQYEKPSEGHEYVKVNLYIENKSDDKISYNPYDWEMQDSDGDIKTYTWVSAEDALNSGEIAKNGKKSGSLIFEVPKNDTGLILHYKSSFWSNKTVEIKL